jgi:hypothetical protein
MDVSACNSLFDLWFVVPVLSKTLNYSSNDKRTNPEFLWNLKTGRSTPGLFFGLSGRHSKRKKPPDIISGGFLRDQQRSTSRIAERALS